MPYSNIVWIKLHLELFDEDDRFLYQLTERQQLLYIKLLYLAGRQGNKISKNALLIIQKVNYQGTTQALLGDIDNIKKVFSKFKETKYFYTFTKFEEIHNRVIQRNSKGTPKELQRGIPDKDKEVDKIRIDKEEDTATSIYNYYSKTIKPGAKEDAIKNISKLLKTGVSKDDLLGRIDAYKAQLLKDKTDTKFYIQANNFFGEKARYKDFAPQESKLKAVDPNCPTCKGTGFVYNQSISKNEFCRCRIKEGK